MYLTQVRDGVYLDLDSIYRVHFDKTRLVIYSKYDKSGVSGIGGSGGLQVQDKYVKSVISSLNRKNSNPQYLRLQG